MNTFNTFMVARLPSLLPNLPSLRFEVGKREALQHKEVPNLPNLPNLFSPAHTRAHTRAHPRAHVYAGEQSRFRLGRLGRLGRSSDRAAFKFPTSKQRLGRLGTWPKEDAPMQDLIAQLRRDFNRLAAFRIDSGEWQQQDAEELGLTIRALITGNDEALIRSWATWCAEQSASYHGPIPPRQARCAHACTTCRHLTRPGRAEPGYCAERLDLPPAYGAGHPLNCLPADMGTACAAWSQSL